MANMSLKINDIEMSQYLSTDDNYQWTINQNFGRTGDTATFYLIDKHAYGTQHFWVSALSKIVFKDLDLNLVIFSGLIATPQFQWVGTFMTVWELDCVGNDSYLQTTVVNRTYDGAQADWIIKDLVASTALGRSTSNPIGMTTNNVMPGPTLTHLRFESITLKDALTQISDRASQVALYGHYVDDNLDLNWYNMYQAPSPSVTFEAPYHGGVYLPFSPTYGHYDDSSSFVYKQDGSTLKTIIYIKGGKVKQKRTDTWISDGVTNTWTLSYDLDIVTTLPTLLIGGIKYSVGVQSQIIESTITEAKQYLIYQNISGGYVLNTNGPAPPPAGATIQLTYNYTIPLMTQVPNPSQIAYLASLGLPNQGRFEEPITDNTLLNLPAAQARGARELQQYSFVYETVEFTTTESWPGHVRPGQVITFKNYQVPDTIRGGLPGINDSFIILTSKISGKIRQRRVYDLTCQRIGGSV